MKKKETEKPEIKITAPKDIEEAEKQAEEEAKSKLLVSKLLVSDNIQMVEEPKDEATAKNIIKYVTPVLIILCIVLLIAANNRKKQEEAAKTSTTSTETIPLTTEKTTTTVSAEVLKEYEDYLSSLETNKLTDDFMLLELGFDKILLVDYEYNNLNRDDTIKTSLDLAYEDGLVSINTTGHIILQGQFQSKKTGMVLINVDKKQASYVLGEDMLLYDVNADKIVVNSSKRVTDFFYNEKHHTVVALYQDSTVKILRGYDLKKLY